MTDRGGNRVVGGVHVVTLGLAGGDGRLRGPRARYTRFGVVTFDRLRIRSSGFDKIIMATSIGLQSAHTAPFGILPHGIPSSLRLAAEFNSTIATGDLLLPTLQVMIFDLFWLT